MRPGESEGFAGGGSAIAPAACERGERGRHGVAERGADAQVADAVQGAPHGVAVGGRRQDHRGAVGEGGDADRRPLGRLVGEALGRVDGGREAAGLEVGLLHRLGDVDGEHHAAAVLLAGRLDRRAGQRDDAGGDRQQGDDGRGGAPAARAGGRAHVHHLGVGPGRARAARLARPGEQGHRQHGQQQQGPQPSRGLEGHESLGPRRQAATPASTSSRAPMPAGQAVTSVSTRSVPTKEPSRA